MTNKDARFGDVYSAFSTDLANQKDRLAQRLQQAKRDSDRQTAQDASAQLAEVEAFLDKHLPSLDGNAI